MSKPIDKLEFWKKRIDTAVSLHYSVYVVHETGWKHIFQEHSRIIAENIPDGSRVLDAGCGYGRMSALFPKGMYVGVDFSPDFIDLAQKKYHDFHFLVGNLKQLPFEDGSFDWAFCVSIKKMVRDNLGDEEWEKMQKELKRVAKNLLVLEYEEPKIYEII